MHIEPVVYRRISEKTAGLDRITLGGARAFRKRLQRPVDARAWFAHVDDPSHPAAWRREVDAYASGRLAELAPGLRAPHVLAIEEDADGRATLWLEDVVGEAPPRWDRTRWTQAFTALGHWQGRWARIGLPQEPWLARDVLRRRLAFWNGARPHAGGDARVADVFARHEALLDELEGLPQTWAHHDCWAANLLHDGAGVVLLDWSDTGYGALGEDLANLVFDSVWMRCVDAAWLDVLDDAALPAYVAGLRAAGWDGDERDVARAYTLMAALKFGTQADRIAAGPRDAARAAVCARALDRYAG